MLPNGEETYPGTFRYHFKIRVPHDAMKFGKLNLWVVRKSWYLAPETSKTFLDLKTANFDPRNTILDEQDQWEVWILILAPKRSFEAKINIMGNSCCILSNVTTGRNSSLWTCWSWNALWRSERARDRFLETNKPSNSIKTLPWAHHEIEGDLRQFGR